MSILPKSLLQKCLRGTWLGVAALALSLSCSEESNPLGYLAQLDQPGAHDALLFDAEYAFNRGDFDTAVELADRANKLDPGSEEGAVIYGYALLGQAGIDPMSLAIELLTQEDSDEDSDESSEESTAETELRGFELLDAFLATSLLNEEDAEAETVDEENQSDSPFEQISKVLGLDEAELANLALPGNKTEIGGREITGAPSTGIFKDYPVRLPRVASAARSATPGGTLEAVNKAITAICPFVNSSVRILSGIPDPRHTPDSCPPSEKEPTHSGRVHFLFAFSHLTEAVAFNSVVLYNPTGEGANIVRRADALEEAADASIADYIRGVTELADTLSIILPTDPSTSGDSMLSAMVNDLEAANRAFKQIPGVPKEITESIDETLEKLEEQRGKIDEAANVDNSDASEEAAAAAANAEALKGALTEGLGKEIGKQIDEQVAEGKVSEEELGELCAVYQDISNEALDSCQ